MKKKRGSKSAPSIIAEAETETQGEYPKSRGKRSRHPKWGPVRLLDGKLYSERTGALLYDYDAGPDRISAGADDEVNEINPGDGGEG